MRRAALADPVLELLRQLTAGDYDIGGRLGVGGMASVYLAHELRLNRRVAIKAMLPELLIKEDMVERFFDEARKQARLEHRNIVPIYSLQWNADLPFFVMKFVDGFSTEDIIAARGALPIHVVQHILNGTIAALQYAHDEGVVHRDVKPANILIDRRGEPIVSDFGIAKAQESPHLTQTGASIGTPAYMSPEQFRALAVTPASDQYSVGVVAYQLLSGSTPFTGSMLDLLIAHTGNPPPPLLEVCPECPPRLASAVMRMLEKSAEDRWPDLRDALPDLLDGMGSEADARRQLVARFPERPTAAEALPLTPVTPAPGSWRSPTPAARVLNKTTPIISLIAAPANGRWELEVGETVRMKARRSSDTDVGQAPSNVAWASNDKAVATVSADGQVTGHAPGLVSITATQGELSTRTELTVVPGTVAAVRIRPPTESLVVGDTIILVAEALDGRGHTLTGHTFEWSCNDSSKAAASPDGVLLLQAAGEVNVTARTEGHEGVVQLTIAPLSATTIVLPSRQEEMAEVEIAPPAPEFGDLDGTVVDDRIVTWSDKTPATFDVSASDVVAPVAAGNAARSRLGVRAGIGAGVVVALAAILFVATRKSEAPAPATATTPAPATAAAKVDSVPAAVDTTASAPAATNPPAGATVGGTPVANAPVANAPVTNAPVDVVSRVSLILTRLTMKVGDSVHAVARAFDASGKRLPKAQIAIAASATKILSIDASGLVIALAPGTSSVTAQSGTAKASETVTVTARPKLLSQSEATEAIKPLLALVSNERWADIQNILQPDVLEPLKGKRRIDALLSGEPHIVSSTPDTATVDFDVALTWINVARLGRNGQAQLRAQLARSDSGWHVTEVSARAKLP